MKQTTSVSRRRFLRGVAGATAAAAFAGPTIVPASVFGSDGKAAPSERITVGFIGCGKMANDYHLATLLGFGDVQAVAVCDVDRSRREHAKRRVEEAYSADKAYKGCTAYADYGELLARKDVDAVVIATPEHWHAIQAVEACKAGKDVYCEKPLTLTLAEAKRCLDAARKHERVFQTGSQQRSNVFGPFRQAAEIVRSGRLGKVQSVTVGVGGPSRWSDLPEEEMEPGLDWDPEGIVKEPLGKDDVQLPESPGHHRDWLDCVRSRKRPVADVEVGARTVAFPILGNLAYWNRRRLRWDPDEWRFVVDDEANQKWLDRERRDPWKLPEV